jgi:effector-binding domain-containing protein
MRIFTLSLLALLMPLVAATAQQVTPPIVPAPPLVAPPGVTPTLPAPGSLATPPAIPNLTTPRIQTEEPKTDGVQPPGTIVPNAADAQKTPELSGPTSVTLEPNPVLMLKGQSTWDDGYENLMEAIVKLNAEAKKLGLATVGRPKTAFLSTDDQGFKFEAMVDLASEPTPPPTNLSKDFTIAKSAVGKALKFTHSGAYDDIDTTYEAITAYLDEKGAKARNIFIEEYLKDTKSSEDPAFEMNIYVLVE